MNGTVVSDPTVVSWGNGRYDVFAFGGDYRLYHWWYDGGASGFDLPFSGLYGLGTPAAVSTQSGRLDVVYRELGGSVGHLSWSGGWATQSLGGTILGWPSAAATGIGGGKLAVYGIGSSYTLWERARPTGGTFGGWVNVSASAGSTLSLGSSPSSAVGSDGIIRTSVRTRDSRLAWFFQPSSTWQTEVLPGSPGVPVFSGSPQAVSPAQRWSKSEWNSLLISDSANSVDRFGIIE